MLMDVVVVVMVVVVCACVLWLWLHVCTCILYMHVYVFMRGFARVSAGAVAVDGATDAGTIALFGPTVAALSRVLLRCVRERAPHTAAASTASATVARGTAACCGGP